MNFKPILAYKVKASEYEHLEFPYICTPKVDGIRCVTAKGQALSRSLKRIPNKFVQDQLKNVPAGLDGELVVDGGFNQVSSAIMSVDGEPDFRYLLFDLMQSLLMPYSQRLTELDRVICQIKHPRLMILPTNRVNNINELLEFEEFMVTQGWEGVCLRRPNATYKCGRSTLHEGALLAIKRFATAEAEIIGYAELQHNENKATIDELGHTKRPSCKAGKKPGKTLGKFFVRDIESKVEFEIGTGIGLTQALRKDVWDHRAAYLGKLITYKSQPYGAKDKPRLPVFLGFRSKEDL